jgi:hypothetical protein
MTISNNINDIFVVVMYKILNLQNTSTTDTGRHISRAVCCSSHVKLLEQRDDGAAVLPRGRARTDVADQTVAHTLCFGSPFKRLQILQITGTNDLFMPTYSQGTAIATKPKQKVLSIVQLLLVPAQGLGTS